MIELYNKDCFEGLKEIKKGSVKLILTDPPFACTDAHWDSRIDFNLFKKLMRECCDEKALFVCFSLQPLTSHLITTFKQCFKYMLYWNKVRKTGYLNAKKVPLRQIEEIIVFKVFPKFYKQTYNPQTIKRDKPYLLKSSPTILYKPRKDFVYGQKHYTDFYYPTNLITEVVSNLEQWHPTQKPLKLMEWLVKTYSNEGDLIVDPFSGSGTTAVACLNTNRNFIGFELNKEYFEKATERIKKAQEIKNTNGNIEELDKIIALTTPKKAKKAKKESKQLLLL